MKQLIPRISFAFLVNLSMIALINAQADYMLYPTGSLTKEVCQNGSNTTLTINAVIVDGGSNGFDTDYLWYAPGGGLAISGTSSGTVTDGTTKIVSVNITPTGTLGNTYILRCRATHNNGMDPIDLDFSITINDVPNPTNIGTPDGTVSCDNNDIELVAVVPTGVTASYSWNPTGETTPSIFVSTAATYTLVASNDCGIGSASITTSAEITPNLSITTCTNANDQLTFEVSATDNDNVGITFTFHENDPANPALSSGGDYSITTTATSARLIVNNVNPAHQGVNYYAKASNNCGTATSIACLALPIELMYFTGRYTGNEVRLDWATATELNNEYFNIERSTDGQQFESIAKIPGAGTSYFTLEYSHTDKEAARWIGQYSGLYYRLKQTDFDGTSSYSDLIFVPFEEKVPFNVENIALQNGQNLQFDLQSNQREQVQLSVYRMDGSLVFSSALSIEEGNQTFNLPLPETPAAGMYLLRLEGQYQMALKKFIVLR